MINHILNGLSAVGNLLDLPGSSVRDALAWKNPFDQYLTPFHDTNRTSGRDLLRHYGIAGQHDTWGNFAGGLATEAVLDPTNLLSGKAIMNTFKARRVAREANIGVAAVHAAHESDVVRAMAHNTRSDAMRAAGHLTSEEASQSALRDRYYINQSGRGGVGSQLAETERLAHERRLNAMNNDAVYPEDFDRVGFTAHQFKGDFADPQMMPVRLSINKPLVADAALNSDELRHIADHARSIRREALPEMVIGGVKGKRIKQMQSYKGLRNAVESTPDYQFHLSEGGVGPTGHHVTEGLQKYVGRPYEVLHQAGYDAIQGDPLKGSRPVTVFDKSTFHPWELAPSPMEIPSASGLPTSVRVPSSMPVVGGIAAYGTLARARRRRRDQ